VSRARRLIRQVLVNDHDPRHLPRRSLREVTAGPDGLMYLTVHQRRQALTLSPHGQ
jgi:hypothetical protein